jgi:hypothetical protein
VISSEEQRRVVIQAYGMFTREQIEQAIEIMRGELTKYELTKYDPTEVAAELAEAERDIWVEWARQPTMIIDNTTEVARLDNSII